MAGLFRRAFRGVSSLFSSRDDDEDSDSASDTPAEDVRSFAVKRQIVVEAPRTPLIQLAVGAAQSVVQGLEWFAALLRVDSDGDVADEFLIEADDKSRGEPRSLAPAAELSPRSSSARVALRSLAVSTRPRLAVWAKVVSGWPVSAADA